jgi:hypothetical protein
MYMPLRFRFKSDQYCCTEPGPVIGIRDHTADGLGKVLGMTCAQVFGSLGIAVSFAWHRCAGGHQNVSPMAIERSA